MKPPSLMFWKLTGTISNGTEAAANQNQLQNHGNVAFNATPKPVILNKICLVNQLHQDNLYDIQASVTEGVMRLHYGICTWWQHHEKIWKLSTRMILIKHPTTITPNKNQPVASPYKQFWQQQCVWFMWFYYGMSNECLLCACRSTKIWKLSERA